MIDGRVSYRTTEPTNGPLLFEHPLVRMGRPVSILDLWMAARGDSEPLEWHERYVPIDRDFRVGILDGAHRLHRVTIAELHAEYAGSLKWRGRPSSFTHFPLDQLVEWRDNFFAGWISIRELAREAAVSEPAAARFVHGETLWYV
jgi:hypothetical protein